MKNEIYNKGTATLADVAKKAGVSRQTAGRILGNDAHKHKPETVELVRKVAKALDYRPNILAKSVVSGRTYSIGVLMPFVTDEYFTQVIMGIHITLANTEIMPIFVHTTEGSSEHQLIHRLVDRRVDGMLVIPQAFDVTPSYFSEIVKRNIPVVCINSRLKNVGSVDYVGTDEFLGGKRAAEYFLSKGHTRLCSVRFAEYCENLGGRHDGFKQTAIKAGVDYCSLKLPGWSLEDNIDTIRDFLRKPERPTAFFCAGDTYAAQLYKGAEKLGLRAPFDFSAIGYADLTLASYLTPSLTTLKQQGYKIGETAARILLDRIDGKDYESREVLIEPILMERESVTSLKL